MVRRLRIELTIEVMKQAINEHQADIIDQWELDTLKDLMKEFVMGELSFNDLMNALMYDCTNAWKFISDKYI